MPKSSAMPVSGKVVVVGSIGVAVAVVVGSMGVAIAVVAAGCADCVSKASWVLKAISYVGEAVGLITMACVGVGTCVSVRKAVGDIAGMLAKAVWVAAKTAAEA